MSVTRQLSLLGPEAWPPRPADLAGLLVAGGQIVWRDGDPADGRDGADRAAARVTVVVDHPWRASAVVAECARRGLAATSVATPAEHVAVRTVYSPLLAPLARAWVREGHTRAPVRLMLDGHQVRLWAVAAGRCEGATSFALGLGLGTHGVGAQEPVGAALAAMGLGAQMSISGSPRPTARDAAAYGTAAYGTAAYGTAEYRAASYRIVGKRRIARLLELIGEAPGDAPVGLWPS